MENSLFVPAIKTTSGIYSITNLVTNNVYVGQSKDIRARLQIHLYSLRAGKHSNSYLQNSFNKYGEAAFRGAVLEHVRDFGDLTSREQYWITHLNPEYNVIIDVVNHEQGLTRNPIPKEYPAFDNVIKQGEGIPYKPWYA
jgi:group I intron endonuclease